MPFIQSSCDIVTIFNGGDPPVVGAQVIIGDTQLIPSPFVSLTMEKYKIADKSIGGILKLTLNGTIVGSSFNDIVDGQGVGTGITTVLRLGQMKGCVCVVIKCSDNSPLIDGYGRITNVTINEGNEPTWVNRAAYTIEIDLYTNNALSDERIVIPDSSFGSGLALRSVSESLSWSINDDGLFNWGSPVCTGTALPTGINGFGNKHIKVAFNITVAAIEGLNDCICSNVTPSILSPNIYYGLDAAERYLKIRLTDLTTHGIDSLFDLNGLDNAPTGEITAAFLEYTNPAGAYLDFRNIEINPHENTINITGDIIYRPSGCLNPDVFTSLTIEQNTTVENENMTISGNIIGLTNHIFEDIIKVTDTPISPLSPDYNVKMDAAEKFLAKLMAKDVIENMGNCYYKQYYKKGHIEDDCPLSAGTGVCDITPTPAYPGDTDDELCDAMRVIGSQISRNIAAGEINFSFNLSNSPECEVACATKVDVSVTHDKPHDNIVEIIIPGRGSKGVLIQNLCCNSAEKYDIGIDATLNRKTCVSSIKKQTIDKLRACAEKTLEDLVNEGVDVSCWFKTNDVETIGNTSYKLSRTYVKPSCP